MTKQEIDKAKRMLAPYVERIETAIEDGGQCLTAYWIGGGQLLFHSLDAIERRVQEIKDRRQS